MELTAPVIPTDTAIVKPTHPSAVDVNVMDTAAVIIETRTDRWIKLVKELGFPIAVASVLLVIIYGLVEDFRDSVKTGNETQKKTAEAVHEFSKVAVQQAGTLERLNSSFTRFEENQVQSHELTKSLISEQKKTNAALMRGKKKADDEPDGGE